jgi:hypothetical protein
VNVKVVVKPLEEQIMEVLSHVYRIGYPSYVRKHMAHALSRFRRERRAKGGES